MVEVRPPDRRARLAWGLARSNRGDRALRHSQGSADQYIATTDRVAINRRAGELTISFGGDTNQAMQFACKLDLHALEQELGFAVGRPAGMWRRLARR